MTLPAQLSPGLYLESARPAPEPSPLRTDVAAFIGRTRRGPVAKPTRVEGWREYVRLFGGLCADAHTPYAVRAYFENGGLVAWIVRVAGREQQTGFATWEDLAGYDGLRHESYHVCATSPGAWSEGGEVAIQYRRHSASGRPEVDIVVHVSDEPVEHLTGLPAEDVVRLVNRTSNLIRLIPPPERPRTPPPSPAPPVPSRPRSKRFDPLRLRRVRPARPMQTPALQEDYLVAIDKLGEIPEVAIVAAPDLHGEVTDDQVGREGQRAAAVVRAMVEQAERLRDRLVLVDFPGRPPATNASGASPMSAWRVADLVAWLAAPLDRPTPPVDDPQSPWRAAAAYHPHVRVPDPLGGPTHPLRTIPPSGPVAGTISLLDRVRGAHHTPANVPMLEVVDVEETYELAEHPFLNQQGINLIKCAPGVGFSVWGGRTLDPSGAHRFVAHRRFIHRLVRTIRRVAEPLAFETNGPQLWFQLVRAITTVLLEAWRTGALRGARPEEAFRVQCDDETNPPEAIDEGRCICRVEVAPAAPLEFIVLRIALSKDGSLEVLS